MPTYDYQCKVCSNVQEEFHSFTVTPEINCTKCGGSCEKIFSPTLSFNLTGNDFPSTNMRMKKQMLDKNTKMQNKMNDHAGPGVRKISDLKK